MRIVVLVAILVFGKGIFAAVVDWSRILAMQSWDSTENTMGYVFGSSIHGEGGGHAEVFSLIYGHAANGSIYLKHKDFSSESMNPTFNWWAIALYGEIVSEETFGTLVAIEDFSGNDVGSGGTLIESPKDFYMALKVSEVLTGADNYEVGQSWYGWVHVSIGDDLHMTLLGADINLTGGEVTVGATPEPSSALLLLVGGALLALRRRKCYNVQRVGKPSIHNGQK